MSNRDNSIWGTPSMTPGQKCKAQLLGVRVHEAMANYALLHVRQGMFVVGRERPTIQHIRPVKPVEDHCELVAVNSIDEALEMAADPARFGGEWR